ncbi:MAG: hypothetical protein NEHIOOID_01268 [Holosporales bacterium]
MNRLTFMNKRFIYALHLSSRSWRSFCAAALFFFIFVFCVDFMIHFTAFNVHNISRLNLNLENAVFLKIDDWGPLFMHGFFSTLITCGSILIGYFFEKRRLYRVKIIRAYRVKKYTDFYENRLK